MAIQRVSTYANHQVLLGGATQSQAELANLQQQVSSGFKTDNFAGLGGQVQQFTDLDQKISRAERYEENNATVIARIAGTGSAIEKMIDISNELKNLIALRRSANTSDGLAFQQQINNIWKSLAGQLNSTSEGRYLFSGTRTDGQAVNVDLFPTLEAEGVPDTSYYLGSNEDITVRAQDDFELAYNVRADDPGIQKVVAALVLAREGDLSNDNDTLQAAYDMAQQGLQGIITVQANVNANKVTLEQINDRHQSLRLYWQGVKEEIINTDLIGASTKVAVNQGILQASFQVFARLSALRLSDFLR